MKKYAIWQNHNIIGYIEMTEHQKETINSIHDIGIYIGQSKYTNKKIMLTY